MIEGKKVLFYTLGCKLNFSETSSIGRQLKEFGVTKVQEGEIADIIVVNTCSVTDQADKKCRQVIRKLIKNNPGAYVIVVGCYAQLKPEEVSAIEGVDLVLSVKDKFNVEKYVGHIKNNIDETLPCDIKEVTDFHTSYSLGDRTRCFLKVQDGCDYFCSYCTIPYARGKSRNMSIEKTLEEVNLIASRGVKEIVITGINTGDFGKSTGESFFDLIKQLDEIKGIERFRISSIEPNLLTDEIVEWVSKSKKFTPHFHIPLQAGTNEVLALMGRRYTTETFAHRIETIKKFMPSAFIGIDVIAGMMGETPELFEKAKEFIKGIDFQQLHVFPYSERKGTKALEIDYVVPVGERRDRGRTLGELSDVRLKAFYEKSIGEKHFVLFEEGNSNGLMSGFTENYIRVEMPYDSECVNFILEVKLIGLSENGHLRAEFVD
jgi:threonylcarbamoyladenosine tRNA methylthiotransferase MtaB